MSEPVVFYRRKCDIEDTRARFEEMRKKCRGIRVFYYNTEGKESDHMEHHKDGWKKEPGEARTEGMTRFPREGAEAKDSGEIAKRIQASDREELKEVEAGTVVELVQYELLHKAYDGCSDLPEVRFCVVIKWDCGYERVYTQSDLASIRVFDLGPTGYKGEMIFCDKCLIPVMGFAWRLSKENKYGDLYDLCFIHYNENEDAYSEDKFYCNIPTGDIVSVSERSIIKPRAESEKRKLIGLFKDAVVEDLRPINDLSRNSLKGNRVLKIVHEDRKSCSEDAKVMPQQDMREADYYNCCAEIDTNSGLVFRSAGCKGIVDVKVVKPGEWGNIFPAHHPKLCFDLLHELATCEEAYSCLKDKNGKTYKYFKRVSNCGLIISGTPLEEISDSTVWIDCRNLSIVIFYMNRLTKLPEKLLDFKESITLVCIQNNNFQEVPDILYAFDKLEHLNMHGNYLSQIPNNITTFKHLSRLYLGDNDIVFLPDIFDQLPRLKKASFENNCLSRLPPTFENLGELETLNLACNDFVIFPEVLLKLKSLKILSIERNRVHKFYIEGGKVLPDAIPSFFQDLFHLQIKGNPIYLKLKKLKKYRDEESNVLLLKGLRNKDILQQIHDDELRRSFRVNVLGNSGAGKSSLVQALTIQKYVVPTSRADHRHTVGIEHHYLPLDINGKIVVLHIWDYAGDDEYAMMNDLFITEKSLVWLVVNLAKYEYIGKGDTDEKVFYRNVGSWLLKIMSHNKNPIVWIICTHKDKCSNNQIVLQKVDKMRQYAQQLCKNRGKSEVPKKLIENIKYIDLTNTFGFAGIEKINEELRNLSSSTSFFSHSLDVKWMKSMDLLQKRAEDEISDSKSPVITFDALVDVLKGSPNNLVEFLSHYHNVGEIFSMEEISENLSQTSLVVLRPQWLIDLLKQVYRHDFEEYLDKVKGQPEFNFKYADLFLSNAPDEREKSGVISEDVLKALWKCHESDDLFKSIIGLFQNFNLTHNTTSKVSGIPTCFHYFPYLMKKSIMKEELASSESRNTIVLKCVLPYFSAHLFLQRLALKYWANDRSTNIYDNGFETMLDNKTVSLHVLQIKTNYSDGIRIHLCSDIDIDLLWDVVSQNLLEIYQFLSRYSPISDHAELSVGIRGCNCNVYLPLMKVTEDVYKSIHGYNLKCTNCSQDMPVICAVPKQTVKLPDVHDRNIEPIDKERQFFLNLEGLRDVKVTNMEEMISYQSSNTCCVSPVQETSIND